MTKMDKLRIYEEFFHKINVACMLVNHEKVKEAVRLIESWSYAHRVGNGEYTEHEQQKIVENVIKHMHKFHV